MDATAILMLVIGVVVGAAGGFGASRLRAGDTASPPAAGGPVPGPAASSIPVVDDAAPSGPVVDGPVVDAASGATVDDAAPDPAVEPEGDGAADFEDPAGFELVAQRRALVDVSIGIADAVRDRDETLWRQLTEALAAAGVTTVVPDGEPFDPEQHVSVLAEPTGDGDLHQTVAATGKVGYLDGQTWLRRPEVAVYQRESQP